MRPNESRWVVLPTVLLLAFFTPQAGRAQWPSSSSSPAAVMIDTNAVTDKLLGRMFQGILMSPPALARARMIVKEAVISELTVQTMTPEESAKRGADTPAGRARIRAEHVARMDRRDARILALLFSRADSARYLTNSAYSRSPERSLPIP